MIATQKSSSPDFTAARFHMVESQIKPNKVTDERILKAMGDLPREIFVPSSMTGIAYIDEDMQVVPGRYLLEPMVLARLLQEADVKPGDRVLDIAPATGYSTAVLASLAEEVVSVESDPALQKQAIYNLNVLGTSNTDIQCGALTEGWSAEAPYDVILINGSVEVVPSTLTDQLAEGGRLLLVMRMRESGSAFRTGEARLYQKNHSQISHRALFDANVNLLPGFEKPKTFAF